MRNILLLFLFFNCFSVIQGQVVRYDSAKYIFIENTKPFHTIEDVLQLKQFKNKVVYIDLWGYGCIACMNAFDYLPAVKEKFKDDSVAYLYIYNKFSDSIADDIRNNYWIKYAIDKKLSGTHLLASVHPSQEINNGHIPTIFESKKILLDKDVYAIPRYMIADKKGKIKLFNAPGPGEKEKLFAELAKLLKP